MKKRAKQPEENYLTRRPVRAPGLRWTTDEAGMVTLEIDNTGFMNRMAQRLFHKPPVSYVHLDKTGSFVWPRVDGQRTIEELGELVEAEFGEKAHPLYERLAKYFQILDSYHFIRWASADSTSPTSAD